MHKKLPTCKIRSLIISMRQNINGFLYWLDIIIKFICQEKIILNHYPDYIAMFLIINHENFEYLNKELYVKIAIIKYLEVHKE